MSERMTEAELREIETEANVPDARTWTRDGILRLVAEVRRLRKLIASPAIEDVVMVGHEGRTYLTLRPEFVVEVRAIREEQDKG